MRSTVLGEKWISMESRDPIPKICECPFTQGLVSAIYTFISKCVEKPLQVDRHWSHDLSISPSTINWTIVWLKIDLSSRNPEQLFFFKHKNIYHNPLPLSPSTVHYISELNLELPDSCFQHSLCLKVSP